MDPSFEPDYLHEIKEAKVESVYFRLAHAYSITEQALSGHGVADW